jgi:hypothetical protein
MLQQGIVGAADAPDRGDVAEKIERQIVIKRGIGRAAGRNHHQRVTVRR